MAIAALRERIFGTSTPNDNVINSKFNVHNVSHPDLWTTPPGLSGQCTVTYVTRVH
jgi:hypothetical protein